jgi:hypothetical protein
MFSSPQFVFVNPRRWSNTLSFWPEIESRDAGLVSVEISYARVRRRMCASIYVPSCRRRRPRRLQRHPDSGGGRAALINDKR